MSIILALSLAGAVSTPASTAPAAYPVASIPQPAEFRDWIIACNNVRHCEASAGKENGAALDWTLSVVRGADGDAAPIVSAAPAFEVYSQPARIRVDGRMTRFTLNDAGYAEGDPAAFLKAIARALSAEVVAADGEVVGRLPVMGATAALRWMDDQQQRAGTVTAILATGRKPADAVPSAPPLPVIDQPAPSAAPARTLDDAGIAAVKELAECSYAPGESEFFRLDAGHSLGLIPCNLGAYQGYSMAVLIDEAGDWSFAPLEQGRAWSEDFGPVEAWMVSGVTMADFASETRMLSGFAKYRGLADCGDSASWAWDGEIFRLASFNEMRECRGTPPGDWPSLWITQNAAAPGSQ